jgi:hypothetical protein
MILKKPHCDASSPVMPPIQQCVRFVLGCFLLAIGVSVSPVNGQGNASFQLPERVQFNRDVRTIFSKTCFACHGPDANARKAKLRLDVREEAIAERDGDRPIVPGAAAKSLAWQRITATDPDDQMPPADFHTQLTPREKAIIEKWINQGAEYETHWAFIPPVRPAAPKVKSADAVRNSIDNFVIRKLEAAGLEPSAPADRSALIRRVSLDLIGLPPSAPEVKAFIDDPADDDAAYGKVVDRLLSSPHFGEHRARHWLDAARYADTSGYQYDKIRYQWVWRDWVINAFNSNMPFDQFTIEQNAGDLLPDATDQTRLATGFHRNHPITIEGGVIDEEYRTEYVMDRVVTTTTTWLGLTFTCARCHDHKYDPIGQDDFYSFYAFFNSVPERGLNGFNPKAKIASPIGADPSIELKGKVDEAKRQFDQALSKAGASMDEWEAKLRESVDAELSSVAIDALGAKGGTKLVKQEDGSVLATGPNPATQTYQIDFTLGDKPTRAIRLEALTHDSHVSKSTGRGHNGNFVLSEVKIEAASPGAPDGDLKPVGIASADANYEQKGYPVAAAIDGKEARTGWAIDGNTRFKDSSAVFTLGDEIAQGSRVRVRLIHTWGGSHTIGRFRISVPTDGQAPTPGRIRDILAVDHSKRKTADRAALTGYLVERFGGPGITLLSKKVRELEAQLAKAKNAIPDTMILTSMAKPRQTHVLMRGEYDKPLKERPALPNVPQALGGLPDDFPRNRLGLAKWLVSADNPLTARVIVNRFWAQIFGSGMVKTIEDFGSQGEYPSHPELLDWLAVEFVESGWNVKELMKTMLMSGAYRQSSRVTPDAIAHDPENRLLAHGPRFRLDAETIRDSALAASGLLDDTVGGPSVYPYHPDGLWLEINNRPNFSRAYPHTEEPSQLYRRSMYTFWKRTVAPPSMATLDAPEREFCVVKRSRTNTPLQAFVMLHDPQFVEAARKLGERMIREVGESPVARITHGFQLCMARQPTERELALLHKALDESLVRFKRNPDAATKLLSVGQSTSDAALEPAELAAYTTIARMILNLSEFITKG